MISFCLWKDIPLLRFTTLEVVSYLVARPIVRVHCRGVVIYPVSSIPWVLRSEGSLVVS